jgi:hypothetical protein
MIFTKRRQSGIRRIKSFEPELEENMEQNHVDVKLRDISMSHAKNMPVKLSSDANLIQDLQIDSLTTKGSRLMPGRKRFALLKILSVAYLY